MDESTFKGAVHAAVASAVGAMLAYNAMRWCATRERRNAVNLAVYAPLLVWEWAQAKHHWTQGSVR